MLPRVATACVLLLAAALAPLLLPRPVLAQAPAPAPQQTEEQKRLMMKYKKAMLDVDEKTDRIGNSAYLAVSYLVKRRAGIPFVEDRIIAYRKQNLMNVWRGALDIYAGTVAVEDIPDRIIPELVERLDRVKKEEAYQLIEQAADFGPRGKAFVPILEWIRDNARSEQVARTAGNAILRIKQ